MIEKQKYDFKMLQNLKYGIITTCKNLFTDHKNLSLLSVKKIEVHSLQIFLGNHILNMAEIPN